MSTRITSLQGGKRIDQRPKEVSMVDMTGMRGIGKKISLELVRKRGKRQKNAWTKGGGGTGRRKDYVCETKNSKIHGLKEDRSSIVDIRSW